MYCTYEDLTAQISERDLIRLTDDAGTGAVNQDLVAQTIADAGEEIDAYLGARHQVPLVPAPPALRRIAVDIALYRLASRRDQPSESRAEKYKAAVRFLENVAKGVVSLGGADPEGSPQPADAPQMHPDNPARLFGRSTLKGF